MAPTMMEFQPAAPSFDDPLTMLHACHERIAAQCLTLENLARHLPQHGSDRQAQQAAQAVLRYFDSAGMQHHQDEEVDLFPLLLDCDNDETATLPALIEQLQAEHRVMEQAWLTLRPLLVAVSEGAATTLDLAAAEHFGVLYRDHIAREEHHLLPLAQRLLPAWQLTKLGENMSMRRGAKLPIA